MSLDLGMMNCAVRIIGSSPAPDTILGEKREAIGTGFIVTVPSESLPAHRYGYVLTANHVLWEQTRIEIQAPDPRSQGERLHPPVMLSDWRQPLPDADLAIAPFNAQDHQLPYQALQIETDFLEFDQRPMLGATIYYIGLLTPLDRPMVRTGNVGAVEQHGIRFKGGYEYIAHLVDCRSYGGFSGSPCFVQQTFASLTPTPNDAFPGQSLGNMNYMVKLCGMFTNHLTDTNDAGTVSAYGVGTMLRSQEILEALMSDKARDERRKWDAQNAAKKAAGKGPKLEPASGATPTNEEFERFEDLTRELVNTPKPEKNES